MCSYIVLNQIVFYPFRRCQPSTYTLRKFDHAIYRYFLALKLANFQMKIFDIFLIFAQNIHCGYILEPPNRGGSNEYPQSMFWSKIRKIGIPLHTPVLLHKSGV